MLFAFDRDHPGKGFYVSNGATAYWEAIPPKIYHTLIQNAPLKSIAFGLGGAYFYKESAGRWFLSSETYTHYPQVYKIGQSGEQINWVAFGPAGKTIVEDNGGYMRWNDISSSVRAALNTKQIKNIQLGVDSGGSYWIEYIDGSTVSLLPVPWHARYCTARDKPRPHLQITSSSTTAFSGVSSTDTSRQLQLLPSSHQFFQNVAFQFTKSWCHTGTPVPKVRYIFSINPSTAASEKAHKNYEKLFGNTQWMWHATTRECLLGDDGRRTRLCSGANCSLCKIVKEGYKKKYARKTGMNLRSSSFNTILLNTVVVGKPFLTNQAHNGQKKPPKGYHSICGLPGSGSALNFEETCVYDDDAVRPRYLLLFDA
ncbi:ADP-ribosylation [Mycena venus]|uniref:ADP-ribosylation n=1 Tax=Mycena venus TaxID=2733690 RepID=A0A8H6TZB7_9AGAR|nr:ADP-ribosylation [Mycena venus]